MQLSDLTFLFAFLPLTLLCAFFVRKNLRLQNAVLLGSSVLFCAASGIPGLLAACFETLGVFYLGLLLSRANRVTLDLLGTMSVARTRVSINLRRAIGFIRANYKEKITLTDLCRAAAVSPQQMIRYFKSELSATPGRYINEVKIDRAKELFLTHPDLSVAEIATELGFPDPHYFTRLFKKLSGETPTGYKKRVHSFDEKKQ